MAYVYRHIRLDKNEPFYIGIGTNYENDSNRYYIRARTKRNHNSIWDRIVAKTDYEVEILMDDLSVDEAKEKEKEFIALYGRIDIGTGILSNMSDGGDGSTGRIVTKEVREKISKSKIGKKRSEELKQKLSKYRTGKKIGSFSEEHKRKLSVQNKKTKIILDTQYGIFYYGTKEAAIQYNLSTSTLKRMLRGEKYNHTSLIYT